MDTSAVRHTLSHTNTHSHAHSLGLPYWPCHPPPVQLSVQWGDSGCSVETLASLQRLSREFHWETAGWQTGWLLVNKPNNTQHQLNIIPTEKKKKEKRVHSASRLTRHIIPVISDNSASICKRLDYAISGELLCWFYYSIQDNFTGM